MKRSLLCTCKAQRCQFLKKPLSYNVYQLATEALSYSNKIIIQLKLNNYVNIVNYVVNCCKLICKYCN